MQKWFFGFFLVLLSFGFAEPLCDSDPRPKSLCSGWGSMQQLRSLIPERIWEQDFQIQIDRKAFEDSLIRLDRKRGDLFSCIAIGKSSRYFLKSTLSGDSVRLLDRYQEFQWSPFWKNPPMLQQLSLLEKKVMKDSP